MTKKKRVICDVETDGFLDVATKLWVVVCKDIDTGERHTFERLDLDPADFLTYAKSVDLWIGHNFIGFDGPVINKLLGKSVIDLNKVLDTLVLSRLLNYNRTGGHSLAAWGAFFNFPKIVFNEFSFFSKAMVTYCTQDVELTEKVYNYLMRWFSQESWQPAVRVEHEIAIVCHTMRNDGFPFDYPNALKLYAEVLERIKVLDEAIDTQIPDRLVRTVEYTVGAKKDGTVSRKGLPRDVDITSLSVGDTFSVAVYEKFNPGSPKQVVTRLNEWGWNPVEKTDGHLRAIRNRDVGKLAEYAETGWKVSEANLATLSDDAPPIAHKFKEWTMLTSRRTKFEEWFKAYNPDTGCIHGNFNTIGAWTQRMSHNTPNMANILSEHGRTGEIQYLGREMRELWTTSRPNSLIIGTDASGIQLRVLAHYLRNEFYVKTVCEGNSDDGTDIHSVNWRALGEHCRSRSNAKTFIYAWLLGAGTEKVASILNCTVREAKAAVDRFIASIEGLTELRNEIIPRDARNGYFVGFDGRKVVCDSKYLMLAGYLQNGEAVIMKHANVLWRKEFDFLGVNYKQRNFVHDEWQTEVFDVNKEEALALGKVQQDAITQAGVNFNVFCPLAGDTKVGLNWFETH